MALRASVVGHSLNPHCWATSEEPDIWLLETEQQQQVLAACWLKEGDSAGGVRVGRAGGCVLCQAAPGSSGQGW